MNIRVPIALQWMFPTPLAILLYLAPESPWWLVRKGRLEEAAVAVRRLGRASALANPDESVAMMRRTIELEANEKEPSYAELFRGTDTYRTLIVCGVYAAQNLTGNLIANQAVYFFRREFSIPLCLHTRNTWPSTRADAVNRGRYRLQPCLRSRSYHLRPADRLRHAVLDPHDLSRPADHLRLGLLDQRLLPGRSWRRRLRRSVYLGLAGTGVPGSHRFGRFHPGTCAGFVGYHRRDVRHPPPASDHRYRARGLLRREHSMHLPCDVHAQPVGTIYPPTSQERRTADSFANHPNNDRAWTSVAGAATYGAQLASSASSCLTSSYRR